MSNLLTSYLYKILMITNTNVMLYMVMLELCVVDRIRKIFLEYLAWSISIWEQCLRTVAKKYICFRISVQNSSRNSSLKQLTGKDPRSIKEHRILQNSSRNSFEKRQSIWSDKSNRIQAVQLINKSHWFGTYFILLDSCYYAN